MSGRSSTTPILLWIFAGSLLLATVIALALGFDLLVPPPDLDDGMPLWKRLLAIQPTLAARWPYEAASTLLFVVGFGALALVAGALATLGRDHRYADLFRASLLISGILGVTSGLLDFGATKITIDIPYCECGVEGTEQIAQFWALTVVQGATDWLGNGAVLFGALGAVLSASVLRDLGLPSSWRLIAWAAAALLVLGIALSELTDTPAGDLSSAIATAILLPIWAIMLARRAGAAEVPSADDPVGLAPQP